MVSVYAFGYACMLGVCICFWVCLYAGCVGACMLGVWVLVGWGM